MLGGRWRFVVEELIPGLPWGGFLLFSLGLGLVMTGLAIWESLRNNRLWRSFFRPSAFQALLDRGFVLDRYGLHGFWKSVPLSIYYEKETLGDYAKIVAYARVSEEVDTLRRLGQHFGKAWFFLPSEVERFVEPPFERTSWPELLHEISDMVIKQDFEPLREHPWVQGTDPEALMLVKD